MLCFSFIYSETCNEGIAAEPITYFKPELTSGLKPQERSWIDPKSSILSVRDYSLPSVYARDLFEYMRKGEKQCLSMISAPLHDTFIKWP